MFLCVSSVFLPFTIDPARSIDCAIMFGTLCTVFAFSTVWILIKILLEVLTCSTFFLVAISCRLILSYNFDLRAARCAALPMCAALLQVDVIIKKSSWSVVVVAAARR